MKFVQRKANSAQSKYAVSNFLEVKKTFLDEVFATVEMEVIPLDLILNWDQTGIKFVPASSWTMEQRGKKRVEMAGVKDKKQITVFFCGNMRGDFLPI